MDTKKTFRFAVAPLFLAGLIAPAMLSGCGEEGLGGLAEQCGLACPTKGVLEGNASISGIISVDSFFGAVVDFSNAAGTVNGNIRAQLDAIALSVGLKQGAAAADIKAAIQARLAASVNGGLTIKAEPARCEANVDVSVKAAAACDVDVDPGSVEVKCEGSCTIDAEAQAKCTGEAKLSCKGTAPNLECAGNCTGSCDISGGAECGGTCNGKCTGECSAKDAQGNCRGACKGTCEGTCELRAGGECKGKCEGSCEYTPPSGSCEAGAEVRCTGSAKVDVECKGGCEGNVTPPKVSAECQASVDARASASIECTPPSVDITFEFNAELQGDVQKQAEFRAWINGLRVQLGEIKGSLAKAEILFDAAGRVKTAAEGAVTGAVNVAGEGDLKASIGAACALTELPKAATLLTDAGTALEGSISAVAEISAAVGGM